MTMVKTRITFLVEVISGGIFSKYNYLNYLNYKEAITHIEQYNLFEIVPSLKQCSSVELQLFFQSVFNLKGKFGCLPF